MPVANSRRKLTQLDRDILAGRTPDTSATRAKRKMKLTADISPTRAKRAREWKRFRQSNLMTQKQLAAAMGIDQWTVFNVENCKHDPSLKTLQMFKILKQKHGKE